jgi:hypothetical protein
MDPSKVAPVDWDDIKIVESKVLTNSCVRDLRVWDRWYSYDAKLVSGKGFRIDKSKIVFRYLPRQGAVSELYINSVPQVVTSENPKNVYGYYDTSKRDIHVVVCKQ